MNQRGFSGIVLLVGILFIIGIGFAIYYLAKFNPQIIPLKLSINNNSDQKLNQDNITPSDTDTITVSSESSGLKLYQYNNFSISLSDNWVPNGSVAKVPGVVEGAVFRTKDGKFDLNIQVSDDPYPLEEVLKTYPKAEKVMLDGQLAVKFIVIAGQAADIYSPTIQTNYNNKRFWIDLYAPINENLSDKEREKAIPILEKEANAEFQKVIFSFKFVK